MEIVLNRMEVPIEKEWLARYREGDIEALGRVVDHFRRPLYAFIYKMTEGRDDADEIFQEVWFRALKRLDRFNDRNILSWLFRIAHNLIIDRARRKKPDCSLQEQDEHDQSLEEKLPAGGVGPDTLSEAEDLGERIRRAVAELPQEQRAVFLMRMEGDLSFKQIAKIQRVSINTALARMQYALTKLKKELETDYQELSRYTS